VGEARARCDSLGRDQAEGEHRCARKKQPKYHFVLIVAVILRKRSRRNGIQRSRLGQCAAMSPDAWAEFGLTTIGAAVAVSQHAAGAAWPVLPTEQQADS
jgi:hypothetical protein